MAEEKQLWVAYTRADDRFGCAIGAEYDVRSWAVEELSPTGTVTIGKIVPVERLTGLKPVWEGVETDGRDG